MKPTIPWILIAVLVVALAAALAPTVHAQSSPAMDMRWDPGAADCAATLPEPLQVHAYDDRTFVFRQNPCTSFEAPFLYLLLGDERALLIDSGAIADPALMPLATQVMAHLPEREGGRLPLVVAHTHSHRDHREGDAQFAGLPGVEIVPFDLEGVRSYYGFERWPEGSARIELGGRTVHVLPAPGHSPNHVVFYDEATGLLFSGDFLLPGRLTIDDAGAFAASARRVAAFLQERPVTHVLGGHVELDAGGDLYPHGATHHPGERPLPLARADLLALPQALAEFNGFYARHAGFVLVDPVRNLMALAAAAIAVVALVVWGLVRVIRRRRRARTASPG